MRSFYTLTILFVFAVTGAQAQIFINTGNPNVDKYKQENPNATMYEGNTAADTAKPGASMKTPAPVKIKQAPENISKKPAAATKPAPSGTPKKETAKVTTKEVAPAKKEAIAPAPVAPAVAAATNEELPPNAEVGKCYARCLVADKYETKEETIIDKPVSYKTKTIPATYKTVSDTLVIKPASVKYKDVPAVYETTVEDVLITPAAQKWVKSTADAGCLSANPADCQVMCLKEVPAVYKKIAHKTIKTPASRQEVAVPAEYKVVSKRVIDQPARQEQTEIAATYKKVTRKELSSKGGYTEWKEILCGNKLTASKIISIQKALKEKGYNPGTIDDVFGAQTKAALIKYQQDKNLPVGNLNMETLKSLGVE